MIICIFTTSVLAKPLSNAQVVRGVFFAYTLISVLGQQRPQIQTLSTIWLGVPFQQTINKITVEV